MEEETEVPIGLSVAPLSVDTHTPGPCTSGCSSYVIKKPKKTQKITRIYGNKKPQVPAMRSSYMPFKSSIHRSVVLFRSLLDY